MNCEDIRLSFIDYLDGHLDDEEMSKLNEHLESCEECKEELKELKKVLKDIDINREQIDVPEEFMDSVRKRALEINLHKQKKNVRPFRTLLIAAVILTLSAATVFAAREPIMELIKLINPESRVNSIVNKGIGERLNIASTDKDIKITITEVVADDIQTLISYKIEDLKSSKEYRASYTDGIDIKERWGEVGKDTTDKMYTSLFNSDGKGTLTLYPIDTESKTINLAFTKLETKYGEIIAGNWDFQIPIKKYVGKTYNINGVIKVENYTIEFNKITVSPTLTKLSFNCRNGGKQNEKVIGLEDLRIVANGKEYKPYNFGHGNWDPYSTIGSGSNEMTFETMYFDNPKEIEVRLSRISTMNTEEKPKEFIINLNETKPQEFEYLGTKLYVDNLKVGKDITFDLNQSVYNKDYAMLHTDILPYEGHGPERYFSTWGNFTEAYYVDKNNTKYDYYDELSRWEEIREKKPSIYIAKTSYTLKPSEGLDVSKEKFIKLCITGYSKTVFVNNKIKMKLE